VPEPTRDPRLLTADQIAIAFHLLREVHPQVTEVVKAHIAAQDQRHAALVEAVRENVEAAAAFDADLDDYGSGDRFWRSQDALAAALAALAQPPGAST
jgi:hypothetical protein